MMYRPTDGGRWIARGACGATLLLMTLLLGACSLVRPDANLTQQAKVARTPGEHIAVADGYRQLAERFRTEAAQTARYAAFAEWWVSFTSPRAASIGSGRYEEAQHCRRVAGYLSSAAADAEALAEGHNTSGR